MHLKIEMHFNFQFRLGYVYTKMMRSIILSIAVTIVSIQGREPERINHFNDYESEKRDYDLGRPNVEKEDIAQLLRERTVDDKDTSAPNIKEIKQFLESVRDISKDELNKGREYMNYMATNEQARRSFWEWLKSIMTEPTTRKYTTTKKNTTNTTPTTKHHHHHHDHRKYIDDDESRRLMNWLQNLFGTKTSEEPVSNQTNNSIRSIASTTARAKLLKATTTSEHSLTETLNKLITVLEHINNNILCQSNVNKTRRDGYFILKVPVAVDDVQPQKRSKREVNNSTIIDTNDQGILNNTINNETVITGNITRRNMNAPPNQVKNKLLAYLNDSFYEIKEKLVPLTKLKEDYSDENTYRIGYILSSIDTLEINLNKLKSDMERNGQDWDDKKILDMFDRLKVFNNVITNLLNSLKHYSDKSRYKK